jgi:UDP-N-acetylmuramoylalanine--D-glutamate ligase
VDNAAADAMGTGLRLAGRAVCVAGLGVSGPPAARALAAHDARVTVLEKCDDQVRRAQAAELESAGITVVLGAVPDAAPAGIDLVVTTPGWRPDTPLLAASIAAGIPVIGDVELAWRLRPTLPDGSRQAWLAVTGTNGKTTTVKMLACMLVAAGHRAIAAGNVGVPLTAVVTQQDPYPVLAVELSSFQLHWSASLRPLAAAVLNVAPDHLDWHGGMEAYAEAKGRIYPPGTIAICNADDAWSVRLAAAAGATGDRVVAFTLGDPAPGQLGVADGVLTDRAFCARGEVAALARVSEVRPAAPHNVANALAAAALARAYGVPPAAVSGGLRAFEPDPHRISLVGRVAGVDYVDDSKATNPHAAAASLAAYPAVVWVAGGLLKGAEVDDLVTAAAGNLRAAVLLGTDRAKFRQALARHAPDVPVAEVSGTDTGVMDHVVTEAAALAKPGDTVLLAPAAASLDMFANYGARGDAFAAAVHKLTAP